MVLGKRADEQGWADSVAGDMERHYSPGRTWETLARALLQLLETGDVLDIASGDGVLGELLAPHARSVLCVDSSPRVVEAARKRLETFKNVRVTEGDMHALKLGRKRFDLVLIMHALTHTDDPARVMAEGSCAQARWPPAGDHPDAPRAPGGGRTFRPSQPRLSRQRPDAHGTRLRPYGAGVPTNFA